MKAMTALRTETVNVILTQMLKANSPAGPFLSLYRFELVESSRLNSFALVTGDTQKAADKPVFLTTWINLRVSTAHSEALFKSQW